MTRFFKRPKIKATPALTPIATLGAMLESCRPAYSPELNAFNARWLESLGGDYDGAGNFIVRVGESRVMWSSHTDTVHKTSGRQKVVVSGDSFKLAHGSDSTCLGADCTTGVWLMREMIQARVAGLYVFHASEEIGGVGSDWLAKNLAELTDGIDFCIAFDRRAYHSVITHQAGGRCCSDVFAQSIIPLLPAGYEIDSTGVFTDSANYTNLIAECSNLSVGYMSEHTPLETQSISHALALRSALLAFDESRLVCSRKAGDVDFDDWHGYGYGVGAGRSSDDLLRFVKDNPALAADYLDSMGVDVGELLDFEESIYGTQSRWQYV